MAKKRSDKIGKAIRARRLALRRSQKEIAGLAETTPAAISHIECGMRQPSADLVARIADALECSVNDLVTGTVASPSENLCLTRVLNAMRGMPPDAQEQVADYCEYLKHRKTRTGG